MHGYGRFVWTAVTVVGSTIVVTRRRFEFTRIVVVPVRFGSSAAKSGAATHSRIVNVWLVGGRSELTSATLTVHRSGTGFDGSIWTTVPSGRSSVPETMLLAPLAAGESFEFRRLWEER